MYDVCVQFARATLGLQFLHCEYNVFIQLLMLTYQICGELLQESLYIEDRITGEDWGLEVSFEKDLRGPSVVLPFQNIDINIGKIHNMGSF